MALTKEELDYLREKYGGTIEILDEVPKTFNHKAEIRLKENNHPDLKDTEVIIEDTDDYIMIYATASCGKNAGKYGVSCGLKKDAPARKVFEAINIAFDGVSEMLKQKGDKA